MSIPCDIIRPIKPASVEGSGINGRPTVSVIVPARNCAGHLKRCLDSLSDSADRSFEVMVVDDASTDGTAGIAEQWGAHVIRLHRQSGPAAARNTAARKAKAEILLFLDSDVCVFPETVARLVDNFEGDPHLAAVFGSYDTQPAARNLISQYKNLVHHFVHQHASREATTFWAGCGAVRRSSFLEAGGLDESYKRPCIEDIELGARLHERGGRILLDPRVQVTHLKEWTLWGLARVDVCNRAVPWTQLILRKRALPNDLNLKTSQRLSTACVFALAAIFAWASWQMPVIIIAAGLGLLGVHGIDRWSSSHRGEVLAGLAGAGLVACGGASLAAISWSVFVVAIALFVGVVALNVSLFRFFIVQRGVALTAFVLPLHCLYYFYSGIGFGIGVLLHVASAIITNPLSAHSHLAAEVADEPSHG